MKAFPRDVEVATMKERHIGIENELIVGTQYQEVPPNITEKLRQRGFLNSVGHDGGGREFRTNPISIKSLLKQVKGNKYLCEYYDTLKSITKVADSGGTHLHISILNSDHPNMEANATALGVAFFEQFQKIAGRKTSWARSFGERQQATTLAGVKERVNSHKSTRGRTYYLKGSMLGPTNHQTLEFRGPKGSNNKVEILAWAEFLDNVVKYANRDSVEGVKFGQLLEGNYISSYARGLKLLRRLSKKDLERTFNGSTLLAK